MLPKGSGSIEKGCVVLRVGHMSMIVPMFEITYNLISYFFDFPYLFLAFAVILILIFRLSAIAREEL